MPVQRTETQPEERMLWGMSVTMHSAVIGCAFVDPEQTIRFVEHVKQFLVAENAQGSYHAC